MSERNRAIAALFERMAELTEVLGGNRFKVNAYARSARALTELSRDVADLSDAELTAIDGIGKGTVARIREYEADERIAEHDALAAEVPDGVLEVMAVPGVGPKSAAAFWKQAGVTCLADLEAGIASGNLAELKGFGPKKLENIRKSIEFAKSAGDRVHVGDAWDLAQALMAPLRDLPGVERIEHAGSLRRGRETIGDVDILVAADADHAPAIFDAFTGHELVTEVLLRGDTKSSVRTDAGMQADLRIVDPSSFGAALMYFTGSKEHNVRLRERAIERGMTLNEYALTKKEGGDVVAADTEEAIYRALDLAWIPPELREDRGEIARAAQDDLPELVTLEDIASELHCHTTASDGRWSITELAEACADRGLHTVAITDHSRSSVQANGLSIERLEAHIEAIRAANDELGDRITVLAGSEVDILVDGSLDYPDDLLAELDVVVASPHASLAQEPKKATARLIRAIENPWVTILGHPTGRLIKRREGLSPDMDALCRAAAERGIALEINANHWRLDLRDTHARLALEHGCRLAIDTDAHHLGHLDMLRYGVMTARRAGATAADVVNCLGADALRAWLASTRS